MVAGVCAGAAEYFGIEVTLVRVIVAVVSVITGGAGVLAYLAAWAFIPTKARRPRSPRTSSVSATPEEFSRRQRVKIRASLTVSTKQDASAGQ
jgi:phage shock protein C